MVRHDYTINSTHTITINRIKMAVYKKYHNESMAMRAYIASVIYYVYESGICTDIDYLINNYLYGYKANDLLLEAKNYYDILQ